MSRALFLFLSEKGGADYEKSHQMVFGNTNYNLEKTDFSNFLEIYNYDDKFYKETGREKEDSIYSYFRSQKVLVGTIVKPTGDNKSKFIELTNQYMIQWKQIKNNLYYYIIEVENK